MLYTEAELDDDEYQEVKSSSQRTERARKAATETHSDY